MNRPKNYWLYRWFFWEVKSWDKRVCSLAYSGLAIWSSFSALMRLPVFSFLVLSFSCLSFLEECHADSFLYEGNKYVTGELVADREYATRGVSEYSMRVGVLLKLSPGWHIYWRNSGDAGLPTRVIWQAPATWRIGSLQWATPNWYYESGGIYTIGYEDEVLLWAEASSELNADELKNSDTSGNPEQSERLFDFAATVEFLVCHERCLPGKLELKKQLRSSDLQYAIPSKQEQYFVNAALQKPVNSALSTKESELIAHVSLVHQRAAAVIQESAIADVPLSATSRGDSNTSVAGVLFIGIPRNILQGDVVKSDVVKSDVKQKALEVLGRSVQLFPSVGIPFTFQRPFIVSKEDMPWSTASHLHSSLLFDFAVVLPWELQESLSAREEIVGRMEGLLTVSPELLSADAHNLPRNFSWKYEFPAKVKPDEVACRNTPTTGKVAEPTEHNSFCLNEAGLIAPRQSLLYPSSLVQSRLGQSVLGHFLKSNLTLEELNSIRSSGVPLGYLLHDKSIASRESGGSVQVLSADALKDIDRELIGGDGNRIAEGRGDIAGSRTTASTSQGILLSMLFGFIAGVILNFMPCVFPVLMLKFFSLLELQKDEPSLRLKNSLVYSLGICSSLLTLALVVISVQSVGVQIGWGFQFQSWLFVYTLIVVISLFALEMLGVIKVQIVKAIVLFVTLSTLVVAPRQALLLISDLVATYWFIVIPILLLVVAIIIKSRKSLPSFLSEFIGLADRLKEGNAKSFSEGVLTVLLSTPCSAPFLGSALAFALSQSPVWTIAVFLSIGCGLAAPYFLIVNNPRLFALLPRPGRWMNGVKYVLALCLLVTALWLVYVLTVLVQSFDLLKLCFVYVVLVGFLKNRRDNDKSITDDSNCARRKNIRRIGGVALIVTFLVVLLLSGQREEVVLQEQSGVVRWKEIASVTELSSLQSTTPIFLSFSARWCITCKVNERLVLHTPRADEIFRKCNIQPVSADWTTGSKEVTELLKKYGGQGVPHYAYIRPDGTFETLPVLLNFQVLEELCAKTK